MLAAVATASGTPDTVARDQTEFEQEPKKRRMELALSAPVHSVSSTAGRDLVAAAAQLEPTDSPPLSLFAQLTSGQVRPAPLFPLDTSAMRPVSVVVPTGSRSASLGGPLTSVGSTATLAFALPPPKAATKKKKKKRSSSERDVPRADGVGTGVGALTEIGHGDTIMDLGDERAEGSKTAADDQGSAVMPRHHDHIDATAHHEADEVVDGETVHYTVE